MTGQVMYRRRARIGENMIRWMCAALCTAACWATSIGAQDGGIRPDIIMVMTDDLDERSLDALINAGLMPNLATLYATQGLRFTESFVTSPICGPSRATYLTGQYMHNHGVTVNYLLYDAPTAGPAIKTSAAQIFPSAENGPLPIAPPQRLLAGSVGVFDDSTTLATRLQDAGYTTAHVGKYLNGYGQHPEAIAISPTFAPGYVPPGWSEWHATIDASTYCVYNFRMNHNGTIVNYDLTGDETDKSGLYQTNVLTDAALDVISRHQPERGPLFLSLMPLAPHVEMCIEAYDDGWGNSSLPESPFQDTIRSAPEFSHAAVPSFKATRAVLADTSDKPQWIDDKPLLNVEDYQGMINLWSQRLRSMLSVDEMIGKVAASLGPDRSANTIWIFTSDNGYLIGDYRLAGKRVVYDGSARVPLWIRHPALPDTPGENGEVVLNNDLAPTILDFAGVSYSDATFDGRSFAGLVDDSAYPSRLQRRRFLIDHMGNYQDDEPGKHNYPSWSAVRAFPDLYVETSLRNYDNPSNTELIGLERYNLSRDPYTLYSSLHHPEDQPTESFTRVLQQFRRCAGARCEYLETFRASR